MSSLDKPLTNVLLVVLVIMGMVNRGFLVAILEAFDLVCYAQLAVCAVSHCVVCVKLWLHVQFLHARIAHVTSP